MVYVVLLFAIARFFKVLSQSFCRDCLLFPCAMLKETSILKRLKCKSQEEYL